MVSHPVADYNRFFQMMMKREGNIEGDIDKERERQRERKYTQPLILGQGQNCCGVN